MNSIKAFEKRLRNRVVLTRRQLRNAVALLQGKLQVREFSFTMELPLASGRVYREPVEIIPKAPLLAKHLPGLVNSVVPKEARVISLCVDVGRATC